MKNQMSQRNQNLPPLRGNFLRLEARIFSDANYHLGKFFVSKTKDIQNNQLTDALVRNISDMQDTGMISDAYSKVIKDTSFNIIFEIINI